MEAVPEAALEIAETARVYSDDQLVRIEEKLDELLIKVNQLHTVGVFIGRQARDLQNTPFGKFLSRFGG